MPTDTASSRTHAARFALRGVAWSLGLFGLLRLPWIEAHAVLPLTRVQGAAATGLFGPSTLPVEVTLACSGADALALCLGAILAYPLRWRTRLFGAAGGVALVLLLNTLRIGTLGRMAASPAWFNALHVYVWPAVLTLAIAGYVFGWMRLADRQPATDTEAAADPSPIGRPQPTRRFVLFTAAFLMMFAATSPFYLESPGVLRLAAFIARAAAATLSFAGVSAHAAANVLWTPRGGFLVTQECISTPLIPVYLAAVCAYSTTRRRLIVGILAAAPLFIVLGIARLLVVALPAAIVASPLVFVHAFYQLLLGAVVVFIAAHWRRGGRASLRYALTGIIAGAAFVHLLGPAYTRVVAYPAGVPFNDPQEAIAILPAFQIGLYVALWIAAFTAAGWTRFFAGFTVLGLTHTAGLLALHALASHATLTANVRDIRGWAVAGPLVIAAAVVNIARPRR